MEDVKFPDLWIETGDDGKISVVMVDAIGWEQRLPPVSPAEDLIAAAEIDHTAYRQEIQRLYDEYPLFEARLDGYENVPLRLRVDSVFQLRLAELLLYFRQEKQRIARCDYCWNFFIPKTKAETHYCDRIFEGQSCKKRGANLKRKKGPEQDDALRLFKQLRDRMYARMLRYQDAPENQRDRLIPMSSIQYDEWEKNARQARRDCVAGKITAEEFLRRIDTTHELDSYDTAKQELPPEETVWQKRVAADLDFDPERDYPESFMALDLREAADDPEWQYVSREELIREEKKGHQSLREEYE